MKTEPSIEGAKNLLHLRREHFERLAGAIWSHHAHADGFRQQTATVFVDNETTMNRQLARAVLAFLALPGTVAFLIPWLLLQPGQRHPVIDARGLIPFVLGVVLLLWCVRDFYVAGKGTLAPWSPPRHLVVGGPYRFSRNPMYLAVSLILWGWAVGFRSRAIAVYAIAVMAAFHLRLVLGEEPWLAGTHGDAWPQYKARVPRWLGRHRKSRS